MRTTCWIGACLGLLAGAVDARAESETTWGTATIVAPKVEAWSGPNQEKNYPTITLPAGTKVVVKCDKYGRPQKIEDINKNHPGWLEIKPPQGSFSSIHQRFIQPLNAERKTWVVKAESPIGIYVGSQLIQDEPKVEKVQLPTNTQVIVLDSPRADRQGGRYYPIQSPDTEPRYIPASAINLTSVARAEPAAQRPGVVAQVSNNVPAANGNATPAKGGAAPVGWNLPGSGPNRPVAGTTALYTNNNAAPRALVPGQRQWTEWGVLEKTGLPLLDGQEVFRLKVNGQPYAYLTAQPGFTLSSYVGRTLTLYGLVSTSPDPSIGVLRVSVQHVSLR